MKWSLPAAIVLSGSALAAAWLAIGEPDGVAPAAGGGTALPQGTSLVSMGDRSAPALPAAGGVSRPGSPAGGLPVPPGVSSEQWQQIVAEHRGRPDGAAELLRLSDYFQFTDVLQRFRALRKAPSPGPELAALAQSIDQTLDLRVQRLEVSGAEARSIKSAVLEVLQPDAATRQAALRQWQATAAPVGPQAAEARARDAQFLRQQAALVAAWSARAPADRDQRALERDLAALKQATYAAAAGVPAAPPSPPRRTP